MQTDLILKKKEAEKGFSLLELLLVVGVGALLLLAGIGTYQLVTSGSTANEAVRLVATVKQQSQRAWQGQAAYGPGNMVPTLVSMQAFPGGVVNAAGTPQDPWGGAMTIVSTATNSADDSFIITFPAVPSASCIQIGTVFTENDTDFVALNIGGGAIAPPITTAAVAAASGTGLTPAVAWTFF